MSFGYISRGCPHKTVDTPFAGHSEFHSETYTYLNVCTCISTLDIDTLAFCDPD